MSAGKEKNILSGGPEPPLFEADAKSFGEVVLRKLSAYGEAVMFVSTVVCNKVYLKLNIVCC